MCKVRLTKNGLFKINKWRKPLDVSSISTKFKALSLYQRFYFYWQGKTLGPIQKAAAWSYLNKKKKKEEKLVAWLCALQISPLWDNICFGILKCMEENKSVMRSLPMTCQNHMTELWNVLCCVMQMTIWKTQEDSTIHPTFYEWLKNCR